MASVPRLYWDTGVFLSFINAASEHSRHHICVDILKHARDGKVILCTSTFTIVEVIRPKGIQFPQPLTAEQVNALNGMFKWAWLKKYQVDENIALRAASISRDTNLKPIDAIHAATAIAAGCDTLQCWDRDFDKVKTLIAVDEPRRLSPPDLLSQI